MNKKLIQDKISKTLKKPIIYIVLLCIILQTIIYNTVPKSEITSDSESYIKTVQEMNNEKINYSRTPVYLIFTNVVRTIGGEENLLNNIALVQKFLFILTLILFYYCIKIVTDNKYIQIILTIIFGISPFVVLWNVMILTESISILEMVILALLTLKYIKEPKKYLSATIRTSNINNDFN